MYMIEITEDKFSCLSEDIEKGIRYIGKAMQCLDELKREKSEKDRYGYRSSDEREMHRSSIDSGRYSRY